MSGNKYHGSGGYTGAGGGPYVTYGYPQADHEGPIHRGHTQPGTEAGHLGQTPGCEIGACLSGSRVPSLLLSLKSEKLKIEVP